MKKIIVLTSILIICLTGIVWAQAPQILNFQGRLNDNSDNPVSDGDYTIDFRIYDAETDGNLVWNQTQSVTITNGVFNVLLNNVTLDLSVSTYYLALQVDADSEMSPRQRIASVVYAMNAPWKQHVNGIYYDTNNVGIGKPPSSASYISLNVSGRVNTEQHFEAGSSGIINESNEALLIRGVWNLGTSWPSARIYYGHDEYESIWPSKQDIHLLPGITILI